MINVEARRQRHARLKEQNVQLKNTPLNLNGRLSSSLRSGVQQLFKQQPNNPLLGILFKRIVGFTLAFLLITPFMSTYQLTQGSYVDLAGWGGADLGAQMAGNTEYTIADVMTEDGFLLKPAINSTEGDRTGFSDIFVYTIEPGDTLSSLAQQFNLKKETLMAENNLWDANRLRVGSQIKILPVNGLSHVVKKGQTIEKIAKIYEVDKELIITQNQLEGGELIVDTALIIPGAKRTMPTYLAYTATVGVSNYTGTATVGRLLWPAKGELTQGYRAGHLALDIANRAKGPIYAAAAGKVIKSQGGWNGGYGNMVIVDHGNGMQTLYAHNEKLYVTVGQYVEQGQTIAWMGRSGRVYGPTGLHVHFEVRIKGVKYNPMSFF